MFWDSQPDSKNISTGKTAKSVQLLVQYLQFAFSPELFLSVRNHISPYL